MNRKLSLALIACCLLLSFVNVAYAQTVDLTDLPANVAAYFGISEFQAELLCSFMFLLFPTIMIGFVMKRSASMSIVISVLVVDFVTMGFLVALGWLDYWIFLIVCLIVGVFMASTLRDMITGK